jgi:hypothetical protein
MTTPLVFNGIDGSTGHYLQDETSAADLARFILGEDEPIPSPRVEHDGAILNELRARHFRDANPSHAPAWDVEPSDLASAGWGVIFAHDGAPAIKDALKELLEHRKAQAGCIKERYYREFSGAEGYRAGAPNESKQTLLARYYTTPGMPAHPDQVPYYLLIVGDPERIPYRFQYQLDIEYAVGRLHFETLDGRPDLDAYASYAHSVVEAETTGLSLPRRAAFFGVCNDDDPATTLSATELVAPLPEELRAKVAGGAGWEFQTLLGPHARKENLASLLGGNQTPALLFTASHGMGFPSGHQRQAPHQGALLCQEWPGPHKWSREIPEDFYFAADDVGGDAGLLGLIAFHFACFGAGTPQLSDFDHLRGLSKRSGLAPRAFVARLPQRLLGHPRGGALAVVGHVERAWSTSFLGDARGGRQLQAFQGALARLLQGYPVGYAMEVFNQRYAALSEALAYELNEIQYGKAPDVFTLSGMWTVNNDARSYVVFGDPAVRLLVNNKPPIRVEPPRS